MGSYLIVQQGPFLTTKAFLSKLEKSSSPRIVNVSSEYASIAGKDLEDGAVLEWDTDK